MRTKQALFIGSVVLVAVAGVALSQDKSAPPSTRPVLTTAHETPTNAPAKSAKVAAELPVICYIEQRDRTITVKAGPKGPVYSVKTAEGKVLYDNRSIEQLSAKAPQLGEFLKTAEAGASGAKASAQRRVTVEAMMR